MNLSSPATVSALLKRFDLHPRRRYGQNYLIDANTLGKIVNSGDLSSGDQVLEIGPGLGVLTTAIAEKVSVSGKVVAVEIDRDLLPPLAEVLGGLPQVRVVHADAMALSWPDFLASNFDSGPISVVANIPYNITSPLIASLLEQRGRFRNLVFLVQKEVAARLAAKPATPDYGAFSVFVQYHATVEIVSVVGRRVFFPPPDVDSAIVSLRPYEIPPVHVNDEAAFFRVVRAAFGQRRKSLLNALSGDPALGWDRPVASAALAAAEIDSGCRGETLSMAEFARIANSV